MPICLLFIGIAIKKNTWYGIFGCKQKSRAHLVRMLHKIRRFSLFTFGNNCTTSNSYVFPNFLWFPFCWVMGKISYANETDDAFDVTGHLEHLIAISNFEPFSNAGFTARFQLEYDRIQIRIRNYTHWTHSFCPCQSCYMVVCGVNNDNNGIQCQNK